MTWIYLSIIFVLLLVAVFFIYRERIQAKKSLHYMKDLRSFENIVAHTNDALFVIEIVNGKILHVNHASAEMLGYTEPEMLQKTYFDLLPKELVHKSAEVIADVWENKGMVFSDIPHLHKNGEPIYVECSAKIGSFDEHPVIVIYARDIRERLKYEKKIREINLELSQKNKDVTDSIRYALRIQQAILPEEEKVQKLLPQHFILYRPKDIVSGDFYFIDRIRTNEGLELIGAAVADCTGHGVPGAFMTMLGSSFLKQSLTEPTVTRACEAIEFVDRKLQEVLRYKEKQSFIRDGMDISFCVFTPDMRTMYLAGANHVAYVVRPDKSVTHVKTDHHAVGQIKPEGFKYTTQTVALNAGDCVYLFTDGFADQFGGPKGKKFKYKQLEEVLVANAHLPMEKQKENLSAAFDSWKGDLEQIDDVLVIGIQV
jgi:PAS domain S-box-containing protein